MPGMNLGVDLGSSQVVIYASDRGIVLREPSVIAVEKKSGKLLACGSEARKMLGRTPDSITAVRPVRKGVISDFDYAEQMIRYYMRRVCAYKVLKPRAVVSVPASVTEVEQRSAVEAVASSGVRKVVLLEEAVAAAIGAGLDVISPCGSMVVDIGGGTTDVAVMSLRGVSTSCSLRVGGDDLDEAIVRYLHNRYHHMVGTLTAERVKKTIGSALERPEAAAMKVPGRDTVSGLPCTCEVTADDLREAMEEPLSEIFAAVQRVLETTPPELAGDIMRSGIVLTGGGARLNGTAERLTQLTGVACRVAEDPEDCVAKGTGKSLKYIAKLTAGVYNINQFSHAEDIWT